MLRRLRKKVADFQGKYDPLAYAQRENRDDPGRVWYSVAPAEVYPATITRIAQAVLQDGPPPELVDPGSVLPNGVALNYLAEAKAVMPYLHWAVEPMDEVAPAILPARALALDLARRWFTQALHVATGGKPIGLHILNDPDYRLG